MKHLVAIAIKFVLVSVILEIVLKLMTFLTFQQILTISLAVTVLSYLVGDLFILAISNNTIATIADAVLAFFTIYMFNYWSRFGIVSYKAAIISAVVIGVAEIFFHKFMARNVLEKHY